MADTHKLGRAQVNRGLEVLELELLNVRISRRQMILYRLYLGCFALLLLSGTCMVVFSPPVDDTLVGETSGLQSALFDAFSLITGLAFYATIILFLFNIGLILKLRRIATVRKRLGLTQPLESAFSERRRRGWIVNAVTGFFVLMGAAAIVLPALLIVSSGVSWSVILGTAPLFLLGGAALLSVHFLRRGMERFNIVQDLHEELKAEVADESDSAPPLDDASYEILAHLERFQIMEQRQQSIARASADRDAFGYALQMSFEAQESKDQFPAGQRQLIDKKILELISEPEKVASESSSLPDGDFLKVGVEGGDVAIQYRVDKPNHRVQVARIASSAPPTGKNQ